jgi:toxin-antitoxin system PIN domain toxin
LSKLGYLPDVNVLVALSDPEHSGHDAAVTWHQSIGASKFHLCPITEAGFVRLMANPLVGGESISSALLLLRQVATLPTLAHLHVSPSWLELIEPFRSRLHGYRQVTDALLLGLAIRHDAVLVTLDQKIQALAGSQFKENVLTLV